MMAGWELLPLLHMLAQVRTCVSLLTRLHQAARPILTQRRREDGALTEYKVNRRGRLQAWGHVLIQVRCWWALLTMLGQATGSTLALRRSEEGPWLVP